MGFNLLCVCANQVAGIKGMLIANKRHDNQVKTYITYNKGRDWRLLQAPASDLEGNDIHCILVTYTSNAVLCLWKLHTDLFSYVSEDINYT